VGRAHLTTAGSKAPAVFVFLEVRLGRAVRPGMPRLKQELELAAPKNRR